MTWQPDYHIERPWEDLHLTPIDLPQAARDVVAVFESLYLNGHARLVGFQADADAFDDVVAGHNLRVDHRSFLGEFFASRELVTALGSDPPGEASDNPEYVGHGFRLAGDVAEQLWWGGVNTERVPPEQAMKLGVQLSDVLIERNYSDVRVYRGGGSEIVEVAFVILDYRRRRIWYLD